MSAPSTATAMPPSEPATCANRLTPPSPPKAFSPKMPAAMPPHAPHSPCNGQTPSTSSIFQRFWVTVNINTNRKPAMSPVAKPPSGCMRSDPAQIATSPASGPLCTKPGSLRPAISAPMVPPAIAIKVYRDKAADLVDGLRRHDVEAEPAYSENPRAQRQKRNAGRWMSRNPPFLAVTSAASTQHQNRDQADPATHGMHDDGARKIVKRCAKGSFEPALDTKI